MKFLQEKDKKVALGLKSHSRKLKLKLNPLIVLALF